VRTSGTTPSSSIRASPARSGFDVIGYSDRENCSLGYEVLTDHNSIEDRMRERGRSPQRSKGLSDSTVRNNLRRIDQILRFCIESGIISEGKVDLLASNELKDEFVRRLAANEMTKANGEVYDEGSRRKFVDVLKKPNEYRVHQHDAEPWECEVSFSATTHESPDYFTEAEFATLRAHARDYCACTRGALRARATCSTVTVSPSGSVYHSRPSTNAPGTASTRITNAAVSFW
jgi:hypothetical protein